VNSQANLPRRQVFCLHGKLMMMFFNPFDSKKKQSKKPTPRSG
jgi:hypothetical protein